MLRQSFRNRPVPHVMRDMQDHGTSVNGRFILGLDGQTTEIFRQVLEFVEKVSLYDAQRTVLTPFPGTPLYDRLLAENHIIEPGRWDALDNRRSLFYESKPLRPEPVL